MGAPFPAVLFDLDGTLADTLTDLANAMNGALEHHGQPTHPVEAYRLMIGEGVDTLIRRALPEQAAELVPTVLSEFRARYGAQPLVHSAPYPGIPELLDRLCAEGCTLAVLSNKREDFTRLIVAGLFSRWPFALVHGERPGVPRKPDPSAALEIARELGVPASKWAFLGDTAIDMSTAKAAGMFPVGVLWGFRSREELLGSGARALLSTPLELFGIRTSQAAS